MNEFFQPLLQEMLSDRLPSRPRLYVDTAMPSGVAWPAHLKRALKRSRLMISVWSAPYTQSEWCWLELMSMKEREDLLAYCSETNPRALVHVVRFCDGEAFPSELHDRWAITDFHPYAYTSPAFRASAKYLDFEHAVGQLADEIVENLGHAPMFQVDFPLLGSSTSPPRPKPAYPML